jgi:hypothetical protein
MTERPATTVPPVRLSGIGQLYVTTVGAVSLLTMVEGSHVWYVVLVVLALPLSLLALWVGFYAGMAVGFVLGYEPSQVMWPVVVVWVAVWTMTAWVNAQIGQKVRRKGWATIAPRPFVDRDDD